MAQLRWALRLAPRAAQLRWALRLGLWVAQLQLAAWKNGLLYLESWALRVAQLRLAAWNHGLPLLETIPHHVVCSRLTMPRIRRTERVAANALGLPPLQHLLLLLRFHISLPFSDWRPKQRRLGLLAVVFLWLLSVPGLLLVLQRLCWARAAPSWTARALGLMQPELLMQLEKMIQPEHLNLAAPGLPELVCVERRTSPNVRIVRIEFSVSSLSEASLFCKTHATSSLLAASVGSSLPCLR